MRIFMLALFSFMVAHSFAQAQALQPNEKGDASLTSVNKTLLLQLVNGVRKTGCKCGDTWYAPAPALTWNAQLEKAAQAHSRDMSRNNYFSHTGQDGSTAGSRMQDAGYQWRNYGENIAAGWTTEQEVITGWLHSTGHCKNIMNKDFREMGVARTGNLWTQDFGTRF